MFKNIFLTTVIVAMGVFYLQPVIAKTTFSIQQAVVWVHCGDRQGSGVVINSEEGFVLTNAHILLDLETMTPEACEVGFITENSNFTPSIYYWADWERFVFEEDENRDFAILRITKPQQAAEVSPFPFIKTDEFSQVDDPISVVGYPSKSNGRQLETNGFITGLTHGIVKTDAEISPGASGGAGIDDEQSLTGIATRILLREVNGVEEVIDYELVDIRSILTWLDTTDAGLHDEYVTHTDFDRYHLPNALYTPGQLTCSLLARSIHNPAVYCIRNNGTRSIFPNKETFFSWFSDFTGVETLSDTQLAQYQLTSNITMKPGTLLKIQSDPRVYLVSNINGGLRWINNEERAVELYGEGWAGFVTDIPSTFFINYQIGTPVD